MHGTRFPGDPSAEPEETVRGDAVSTDIWKGAPPLRVGDCAHASRPPGWPPAPIPSGAELSGIGNESMVQQSSEQPAAAPAKIRQARQARMTPTAPTTAPRQPGPPPDPAASGRSSPRGVLLGHSSFSSSLFFIFFKSASKDSLLMILLNSAR